MKKITDYKRRIGDKLDYVEHDSNERLPVIITNMIFDGFVFLIEFKHENDSAIGVTEHPDKLKQRLHIPVVSTRYIVAEEKEGVFEQLTCCVYDNLNDAQNFADAMADSLDYWDKKIAILNVC